jgi:hypothetical protein
MGNEQKSADFKPYNREEIRLALMGLPTMLFTEGCPPSLMKCVIITTATKLHSFYNLRTQSIAEKPHILSGRAIVH